ncbi:archaellin/type IV pilin N-terminal domain-containing protein [Halorubellus salinus]|uniref:archaellin/type IV pilin N-terminal domain-containing protein n=1 Tax=Halorubellus salinus TaxID=755309 RepID=UPI001D065586|nr:archaellin/type IV pilin N-terminal domain-containing protein [Halorubellus salinus]
MIVENPTNDDERGQVGIGTLIIFIAMVLVAAVAAGVLINTAGLLEASASDTASDSQAQVSNQITVVSAVGETDSNDEIQYLNFTVMKSAGSGDIDLGNTSVQYQSDDKAETLGFGTSGGANTFIVTATDSDTALTASDDIVLNDTDERKVITINLASGAVDDTLAEGEDATVKFVDQSGATTIYGVDVPNTVSGETYVSV